MQLLRAMGSQKLGWHLDRRWNESLVGYLWNYLQTTVDLTPCAFKFKYAVIWLLFIVILLVFVVIWFVFIVIWIVFVVIWLVFIVIWLVFVVIYVLFWLRLFHILLHLRLATFTIFTCVKVWLHVGNYVPFYQTIYSVIGINCNDGSLYVETYL